MEDVQMYKCEDGNIVSFLESAVRNQYASTNEGRPVFDTVLYAEITSPGQKNQIHRIEVERKLHDGTVKRRVWQNTERGLLYMDDRFSKQLDAWRKGRTDTAVQGMPLSAYPMVDVAQAASLRATGVHSVEQLAAVPDANLGNLGPQGRQLRDGAKAFLAAAAGQAPLERLTSENNDLKDRIAIMERQMAQLVAEDPEAEPEKKKPGRPRKVTPTAQLQPV